MTLNLARRRRMAALAVLLVLLTAFVPIAARGQAIQAGFHPTPIDSVAFATRQPLPGQLAYLQAIRYIDDGMRYIDPHSRFFVSPAGEICFRVFPNSPTIIYDNHHSDWCMYPQHVARVEAMANKITNTNEVRLWCARPFPQCARRIDHPNPLGDGGWVANTISAATLDYREQRAALQNLIYLMGGNIDARAP